VTHLCQKQNDHYNLPNQLSQTSFNRLRSRTRWKRNDQVLPFQIRQRHL